MLYMQTIRRRKTIGRTIKSLRPSNRTPLNVQPTAVDGLSVSSMPASELLSSLTFSQQDEDHVLSTELSVSSQPETVCVDVSGCSYARQSRLHLSEMLCRSLPRLLTGPSVEDDDEVAAEHRRLSSWRQTIGDVEDVTKTKPRRRQLMAFSAVDVDRTSMFRSLTTKKTSCRHTDNYDTSLVAAGYTGARMASTLQISTSRQHKASAASKSGGTDDWRVTAGSRSFSSSWRQSLKYLLKGVVRTKSSVDLWATMTVQQQGSSSSGSAGTAGARKTSMKFRRANSLPRSLKTMKRHSSSDTGGASTESNSKSIEDQLHSAGQSSGSLLRQEITSAGERLGRSVSLSSSHYHIQGNATSRMGRPQSMEVHIVAIDEFGRPSSAAVSPSSGNATERRVHVSIPEQPWTKPFANVRLRHRTTRVVNSDKYQSSSDLDSPPTPHCIWFRRSQHNHKYNSAQSSWFKVTASTEVKVRRRIQKRTPDGGRNSHWSSVSGSAERQSVDVEFDVSHVNDSAVSLSSNSADCRRALSNDDSITLKNCSSDSTLNDDVTEVPVNLRSDVTHGVRRLGVSTFNPFGCRQYSTSTVLESAVSPSLAGRSATRNGKPPNPPRRTTSLSRTVSPSRSLPPPSAAEKTSEIQKLASLVEKLAATRRVSASSFHTLPSPRFNPPFLKELNPLNRDESRLFTSSPSGIKMRRGLDFTASLSRQTTDEKERSVNYALANDTNRYELRSPLTLSTDDELISASSLTVSQSILPQHSYNVTTVSSPNNSVVDAVIRSWSTSVGVGEVGELRDADNDDSSTQKEHSIATDNRDRPLTSMPDVSVSQNCSETCVSQATMLVSSSERDIVMTTDCGAGPLPVSARLIITSPVSSRACFINNPHRRSMCKPLTLPRVDEVESSVNGGVQINESLRPVTSSGISSSLRRHRDPTDLPMVVVDCTDSVTDPSNHGRSWYDVVHGGNGRDKSSPVVAESGGPVSSSVIGLSLGGEYDTRSISSQSSFVSDKSSKSNSLRRSAGQNVTETSALNSSRSRDTRLTSRMNASSPVLSDKPRIPLTSRQYSVSSSQSFGVNAAGNSLSKYFAGVNDDSVVVKGTNLKRLKKSKIRRPKNDADKDLAADTQRLSRPLGINRPTNKTTPSKLASIDSSVNDWRLSPVNETETLPGFMSNSLGRHETLRAGNVFADHCSAAAGIIS